MSILAVLGVAAAMWRVWEMRRKRRQVHLPPPAPVSLSFVGHRTVRHVRNAGVGGTPDFERSAHYQLDVVNEGTHPVVLLDAGYELQGAPQDDVRISVRNGESWHIISVLPKSLTVTAKDHFSHSFTMPTRSLEGTEIRVGRAFADFVGRPRLWQDHIDLDLESSQQERG